jgi:hypothetical protein
MAIKRLHYHDQQFLVVSDFADQQRYHLDMRRRMNRLLHTFGTTDGLQVIRTGTRQVTVKAGAAIDRDGRELVLEADQVLDLGNASQFPPNATVFVTLAYQEAQTDPSTAGASGNTRITETPLASASTTAPSDDGTVIRLARFVITAAGVVPGNVNEEIDGGVRRASSSRLAAGSVGETDLAPPLATKINTPTTIASVDGVSSPDGKIDLEPSGAITITPDVANRRITIAETHSALTDNPHATTAAQVGALALSGGTLTGSLQVAGNLGIGTAPTTRLHVAGTGPLVRIVDEKQAAGRILVSDGSGNAFWRDCSRYFSTGDLKTAGVKATKAGTRIKNFLTFDKASAESAVEVRLNARAISGGFGGGTLAVSFQIRIDDELPAFGNEATITGSQIVEHISIFAVFPALAPGNHVVSVFARTHPLGPTSDPTSDAVSLEPGNLSGGRLIVKETFA